LTYTEPLILLFLLLALAGSLRTRGAGRKLVWLAVIGLFLVSWPPVEYLMARVLESPYPMVPMPMTSVQPQALVVLASSVRPPTDQRPYATLDGPAYERCERTIWLHSKLNLPVLICGGMVSGNPEPCSVAMRRYLERAGVPGSQIWTEERSIDTHQNALYGAEILRQHGIERIALVTEARYMTRAAASFRKQGIEVVPAPALFRKFMGFRNEMLPSWKAIQGNEATLHEFVGLAWYRMRGWI
jgi:uncharacterized SAM-binding protein YcdF (DUF218 family)